jgi:hypothetical protein
MWDRWTFILKNTKRLFWNLFFLLWAVSLLTIDLITESPTCHSILLIPRPKFIDKVSMTPRSYPISIYSLRCHWYSYLFCISYNKFIFLTKACYLIWAIYGIYILLISMNTNNPLENFFLYSFLHFYLDFEHLYKISTLGNPIMNWFSILFFLISIDINIEFTYCT